MFSLLCFDVYFTIMFSLIERVKLIVFSCKMNFENSLETFIKLPEIYLTNKTKSNIGRPSKMFIKMETFQFILLPIVNS